MGSTSLDPIEDLWGNGGEITKEGYHADAVRERDTLLTRGVQRGDTTAGLILQDKSLLNKPFQNKGPGRFGKLHGPLGLLKGWKEFASGVTHGHSIGRKGRHIGLKERPEGSVDFHAPVNEFGNVVRSWDFPARVYQVCLEVFFGTLFAVETNGIRSRIFRGELVPGNFQIAFGFENPCPHTPFWLTHRVILSLAA